MLTEVKHFTNEPEPREREIVTDGTHVYDDDSLLPGWWIAPMFMASVMFVAWAVWLVVEAVS